MLPVKKRENSRRRGGGGGGVAGECQQDIADGDEYSSSASEKWPGEKAIDNTEPALISQYAICTERIRTVRGIRDTIEEMGEER